MKHHIIGRILALWLCLAAFNARAAEIRAEVNRSPLVLNEIFMLTLSADENITATPDLSVLEPDFKVYATSVSRQNYQVNGDSQTSVTWEIGLMPLRLGEQEIPAIRFGSDSSAPLKISVVENAPAENQDTAAATADLPDFTIAVKIANSRPQWYVQQQIVYDVIITDAGGLQGGSPQFEDSSDWMIKSLGQPEIRLVNENGRRVRKISFKYALFPQKSGELKLPDVLFNGFAIDHNAGNRFNVFNDDLLGISLNMPSIFGSEVPVKLSAAGMKIDVLPPPAQYKGSWWLPAADVSLSARWTGAEPPFKAGESFTREIVLKAVGVADSQLPDIKLPQLPGWKQYPEKSQTRSVVENGLLTAIQTTKIVYIPQNTGVLTLPEMSVEWFNVNSGKIEKAILPAAQIEVGGTSSFAPQNPSQNQPLAQTPSVKMSPATQPAVADPQPTLQRPRSGLTTSVLTALAFLAGFLLSYAVFKCRGTKGAKPLCETRRYPDFIIQKAYQNDFRSLRDALVSWATGAYPDSRISNLKDVASAVDNPRFSEQIDVIIARLYNPEAQEVWNPKVFTDIFKEILKRKKKIDKNRPPLPPLYE